MDRRTFVSGTVAVAATPVLRRAAQAQSAAQNVVLVHGLFADGSCWSEVIARLQSKRIHVTAVQNPLTTLQASVEATRDVLAWQQGPTVLVAHSFGGMILTEAGVDPKVSAIVYVAARAPDAAEDYTSLAKPVPGAASLRWHCLVRRLGKARRRGVPARLRGRRTSGKGAYPLCCPGTVQPGLACRQDDAGSLAIEAVLVRRVNGRSDDQSGSPTLHGKADGSQDDRGQGEPPLLDLAARCDCEFDPRSSRANLAACLVDTNGHEDFQPRPTSRGETTRAAATIGRASCSAAWT